MRTLCFSVGLFSGQASLHYKMACVPNRKHRWPQRILWGLNTNQHVRYLFFCSSSFCSNFQQVVTNIIGWIICKCKLRILLSIWYRLLLRYFKKSADCQSCTIEILMQNKMQARYKWNFIKYNMLQHGSIGRFEKKRIGPIAITYFYRFSDDKSHRLTLMFTFHDHPKLENIASI